MKIGFYAGHVGSGGLSPSGQFGGGELHTFGFLQLLNKYYEVTPIVQNGVFPSFEQAREYGFDLGVIDWKPEGDSVDWIRQHDVLISMNHGYLPPPICERNILSVMFPQHPEWDVSGYDTILANSHYTAKWIKNYWGREAEVIYPPINLDNIRDGARDYQKTKRIIHIGRFFDVPGGNNKRHKTIIEAFRSLQRPDWELCLVGSVNKGPVHQKYYQECRKLAEGDERIKFFHDLDRKKYLRLMAESIFCWAATGYETQSPSSKEHFGIFAVEAMTCGTIPLVHNSGGTPETGCVTWDTPGELVEKTNALITDIDAVQAEYARVQQEADRFDLSVTETRLLDVMEQPKLIKSDEHKFKIYMPDLTPGDIKVALWTDSVNKHFGFSTVAAALASGLLKRGFRVAAMGIQETTLGQPDLTVEDVMFDVNTAAEEVRPDQDFMKVLEGKLRQRQLCTSWKVLPNDYSGQAMMKEFLALEKPDVLYLNYDIGNIRIMIDFLREIRSDLPIVCYVPIEGKPVIPQYIETLRLIKVLNGTPILYSRFGQQAVLENNGPRCDFVYHGADHAPFRVLGEQERRVLRFAAGLDKKFVCMFVGRNKRTKGFGTLFDTAQVLLDRGRDDIIWYLHTDINDQMKNSSMPLGQIAMDRELSKVIRFPIDYNQGEGPAYDEGRKVTVPDTDDLRLIQAYNMSAMSMIELFNLADCFVNMSELEGFGLPSLEAMGCGLPVISVDDMAVQREVLGPAPMYVPVSHFDSSWHTGAKLAQANPERVADAIEELAANKQLQLELRQASLEQHAKYGWDDFVDYMGKVFIRAVER